jgi:putative flippase GtrA
VFRALGAQVVCVEPQPVCIRALRKRYDNDPRVVIIENAVAEKTGDKDFYICEYDKEIIRYVVGGGATAFLCYSTLIILVEIAHVHYLISSNIAGFSSYVYSYLINFFFVFKKRGNSPVKKGLSFISVQVGLLFLGNFILFTGVDFFHVNYFLMVVIVGGISAVLNYTLLKLAVFR